MDSVNFGDAEASVEIAVAVGGNQFVMEVRFATTPSEELRAIMWRSPSLEWVFLERGMVLRQEDDLDVRPAVQAGDRVRVLDTDGDWEVARVVGDDVELRGREGTVPIEQVVLAGPRHLAWQEVNTAVARGQSNAITQVLCGQGHFSRQVRCLVSDFL